MKADIKKVDIKNGTDHKKKACAPQNRNKAVSAAEQAVAEKDTARLQAACRRHISRGRQALLIMIFLSLANIVLMTLFSNRSFILTAAFPREVLLLGYIFSAECGTDNTLIIGVIMAVMSVGLYSMCWFMAGKHHGWLAAAAGMMVFDVLFLLAMAVIRFDRQFISQYIIQLCFEGVVLFYLLRGAAGFFRIRALCRQAALFPMQERMKPEESSLSAD